MKKSVCALLAVVCLPAWSLDWSLPIFTVRYEVAGGICEDPDDDTLAPSSLRNTVTFRVKEEADPATFGLGCTLSAKDYYQQSGDYSYLKVEHDAAMRVADPLKLGYALGAKWMQYPELDSKGLSKNGLTLSAGGTAAVRITRGTSVEAEVAGRFSLTENPADAVQTYTGTAGLSTRLGDWLLAARYRGEFRFPVAGLDTYHTGSVSLQWNPN
jgi:hypothetical protein